MALRVCVGGATGWTGSALVRAVCDAADLELSGAVARSAAGKDVAGIQVTASVADDAQRFRSGAWRFPVLTGMVHWRRRA